MSEMVERTAKAIYEARWGGGNWDVLLEQRNANFVTDRFRTQARAAIEAMREPTEKMDIAGHEIIIDSWERSAGTVWAAMIDAALSEEK